MQNPVLENEIVRAIKTLLLGGQTCNSRAKTMGRCLIAGLQYAGLAMAQSRACTESGPGERIGADDCTGGGA